MEKEKKGERSIDPIEEMVLGVSNEEIEKMISDVEITREQKEKLRQSLKIRRGVFLWRT